MLAADSVVAMVGSGQGWRGLGEGAEGGTVGQAGEPGEWGGNKHNSGPERVVAV